MRAIFIVLLLIAPLTCSFPALADFEVKSGRDDRPNVIFLITDDQAQAEFGFLKHQALTPNIDRLAKEGIYFSQCRVSSSVCTPSRYTCLTGQFASRNQSQQFLNERASEGMTRVLWNTQMVASQHTLPKVLQASGYKTGLVGKWHIGGFSRMPPSAPPNSDPLDPKIKQILIAEQEWAKDSIGRYGFDFVDRVYAGNHHDSTSLKNTKLLEHNMEWITEGALDFIEESKDVPFYLYMATTLTHYPDGLQSLKSDPRISGAGMLDEPVTGVQPSREDVFKRTRAAGVPDKLAHVTWLDDSVGSILNKLEELKIADKTIIVYFDDHGMEHSGKGTCYEAGLHTQMIVHAPSRFAAGTCDKFVQNVDIVPTILDLCGVDAPEDMKLDGRSMLSLLRGEDTDWRDDSYGELGFSRSVTTKKWKYLAFRVPPSMDPGFEKRMEQQVAELEKIKKSSPWASKTWKLDPEARITQMGLAPGGYFMTRLMLHANPQPPFMKNYYDADQLFDLENDADETTNLASDPAHAQVLAEMKDRLKVYLDDLPGTFAELKE